MATLYNKPTLVNMGTLLGSLILCDGQGQGHLTQLQIAQRHRGLPHEGELAGPRGVSVGVVPGLPRW